MTEWILGLCSRARGLDKLMIGDTVRLTMISHAHLLLKRGIATFGKQSTEEWTAEIFEVCGKALFYGIGDNATLTVLTAVHAVQISGGNIVEVVNPLDTQVVERVRSISSVLKDLSLGAFAQLRVVYAIKCLTEAQSVFWVGMQVRA